MPGERHSHTTISLSCVRADSLDHVGRLSIDCAYRRHGIVRSLSRDFAFPRDNMSAERPFQTSLGCDCLLQVTTVRAHRHQGKEQNYLFDHEYCTCICQSGAPLEMASLVANPETLEILSPCSPADDRLLHRVNQCAFETGRKCIVARTTSTSARPSQWSPRQARTSSSPRPFHILSHSRSISARHI
ncbi:uncharacterized protein M421DRAFT_202499 [Didymella exigua CBS 183.55]|uniref:Uncharacterized protein n=1 Tax=Didymella exigua CBS 183.55 TaxID=1150837 RepID=A0A6A5S2M2_9PLEO|nr:uncharacterized protein M421DRAFT_202499 [Didymella exigua CBS 183.55]KAF1933674.1 hypothetical protein M421DRAFT_202499 [Didymella exigua CBS 183.55]